MRQGHSLVITAAKAIAAIPKKAPKKPVPKKAVADISKPRLNQRAL